VFRNLIDNARSFSPGDGVVRITLAREKGQVVIRVEDDGPGIPPDNLETVFERFYTSRPKGAAFGGNSGLGLSIARQIIQAHGGSIQARNRIDPAGKVSGARFEVILPEARA
jgi:two-component system sensor histidine kinase ChvG